MAGKIRVLQVVKTLNISGAERFAIDLAACLNPVDYEVQVCAFFKDGSAIEDYWYRELNGKGIVTWYAADWHGLNHISSYLQGVRAMANHLKSWPADIINTHFQLGTLAGLYCRSQKLARRLVRTAQNHSRKEWSPDFYGWLRYILVSGWVYPIACDVEVGVSRAIVEELRHSPGAHFARRTPKLITNAIPNDLVQRAQSYLVPQREKGQYVVGSIGRLMPQKGYRYLLEAVPMVRKAIPGVQFWFVGDGELKEALEEKAHDLGIADCVQFLGRKADVFPWLRQMDLFVLPSLWEGFALVIMESMAAGVPIIATDIAGTRDMIQQDENGWLVPPADGSALADAIIQALQRPSERERVAAKAFTSLEAVKLDRITGQYDQLYKALLR